jgi:hypothetical protein
MVILDIDMGYLVTLVPPGMRLSPPLGTRHTPWHPWTSGSSPADPATRVRPQRIPTSTSIYRFNHRGQGESLVPLCTRESVSLSYLFNHSSQTQSFSGQATSATYEREAREEDAAGV